MNDKKLQDNSEYARVTSVLSPFSGLDKVPPAILKNAGRRGTKVHEICESIIKGLGDWGNDDETKPYVHGFRMWWDSEPRKVLAIEQRFYDKELMITGAVDIILDNGDGTASIIDLKTSAKESKTWPLQGSAYAHMARQHGYNVTRILFVHLNKHGIYPGLCNYDDQFETFHACLMVYNYFYRDSDEKRQKKN